MSKQLLLASFIEPKKLECFLNELKTSFGIAKENVFIYEDTNDDSKLITTFKLTIKSGEKINFTKVIPNAISIHKRGKAMYTINALNSLIETLHPDDIGNIDYRSVKIDWADYQDKFLLYNKDKLQISNIKRIL